jgi:hypothetical protein
MKSIWFFLGLLITTTIIFLSLNRTTLKVEYFSDPSIPINGISSQLEINQSRIRNFQETGDINNPREYSISFEIHPRNIMMKSDPLLSDIEKKIKDMISTNKTFDIKSSTNQDVFLSKITINQVETPTVTEDKQKKYVQFVNPELKGAINYLKDTQSGLPDDPFLDPRYTFDKGKLVLNVLPTLTGNKNVTTSTPSVNRTRSSTRTNTYDDSSYGQEEGEEGEEGDEGDEEGDEDQKRNNQNDDADDTEEVDAQPETSQANANDSETVEGFNAHFVSYQNF